MKVLLILSVLVLVASAQWPSRDWESNKQQWPKQWDRQGSWVSKNPILTQIKLYVLLV